MASGVYVYKVIPSWSLYLPAVPEPTRNVIVIGCGTTGDGAGAAAPGVGAGTIAVTSAVRISTTTVPAGAAGVVDVVPAEPPQATIAAKQKAPRAARIVFSISITYLSELQIRMAAQSSRRRRRRRESGVGL